MNFSRVPTPRDNGSETLQRLAKIDSHQIPGVRVSRDCKHLLLLFMFLGAILLSAVAMNAQLTTADVVGTVTDTTGAVVPNANVTLTNQRTNETRNTQSDGGGQYAFTLLLPGNYSVRIEAQGFKTFTSKMIVSASDRAWIDGSMHVDDSSASVDVTA